MSSGSRIDFTDPNKKLPDMIVLDSSLLVNLISSPTSKWDPKKTKLFTDSQIFFSRLVSSTATGQCIGLAPLIAITETIHFITKITVEAFATAHSLKGDFNHLYKNETNIIQKAGVSVKIEIFFTLLKASGIVIIQPSDLLDPNAIPLELMIANYVTKINLLSSDSYILAIADRLRVKDIASLDKDFLRIVREKFNIYTSPACN